MSIIAHFHWTRELIFLSVIVAPPPLLKNASPQGINTNKYGMYIIKYMY